MTKKNSAYQFINSKKYIFGIAFVIALLLQFIPIKTNLNLSSQISSLSENDEFLQLIEPVNQILPLELPVTLGPGIVQATGGFTITKSGNPSYPNAVATGEEITYQLILTNNTGSVLTTPILVSDTIPAYTNCNNDSVGSSDVFWFGGCSGGDVVWLRPTGSFSDSYSIIFSYTVVVTDVVPFGEVIVNDTYLAKQVPPGIQDIGTVVVTTPIIAPQWWIDKAISFPSGDIVAPGQELEYTISYSNAGGTLITGTYFITDTVPEYTTLLTQSLVHTNYSGIEAGSVVTWTLSDPLSPGDISSVNYRVQVANPLTQGLQIVNYSYGITGANVFDSAQGDPISITVESSVSLDISKSLLNPRLGPGDVATYLIDYNNSGNAIATDVWITDTLPTSVTFISSNPAPTNEDAVNGVYGWYDPTLAPNTLKTIEVNVLIDPNMPDGTIITNTVMMTSPTEGAVEVSDILVSQVFIRPDIGVKISGTDKPFFTPTEPMSYTIIYSNDGNLAADITYITVTLEKMQAIQNSDVVVDGPVLVSNNGSVLVFEHQGILSPTQGGAITITGNLVEEWLFTGENFRAVAKGFALPLENNTSNNVDSVSRKGRPGPPVFALLRPAGDLPTSQEINFYADDIRDAYNNWIYDGTEVNFTIGPVGQVLIPTATTSIGKAATVITSTQAGESQVTVVIGGVLTRIATVNFIGPALGVSKSDSPDPVPPGRELVYTIVVSNTAGPNAGDLTNVVVTDTLLSNNLIFQSATPSPTLINGSSYRFELGTIKGTTPKEIVITTLVSEDTPDFSTVTNTVVVAAKEIDETEQITEVTEVIIPVIEKFVNPDTVMAGEVITYTIVYKNKSTSSLSNVRITDTMPLSISGILNIDSGGANIIDNTPPQLVFNHNTMASGEILTITIVGQASFSPWPPTPVEFTNYVSSNTDQSPSLETYEVVSEGIPNVPDQIIVSSLTEVPAGTTVSLAATVFDMYDNLVLNGTPVAFSASSNGSISPSTDYTYNGEVFANLSSNIAGTVVVTITAGSVTVNRNIVFLPPSLTISKSATPDPVSVGGSVTYFIEVTNTSQIEAINTVITDSLGDNLMFTAASMPYTLVGNNYVFELGTLQPTQQETLILTATVSSLVDPSDMVTNTAFVGAAGITEPPSASVAVSIYVPTLNKIAMPNPVWAGDLITYTIIYQNATNSVLTDVSITDMMPDQIVSLYNTNLGGAVLVDGILPELVINKSTMSLGEVITLTLVGRMQQSPWPATLVNLVNMVTATNETTDTVDTWTTISKGGSNKPANITVQANPTRILINSSVTVNAFVTDEYGNPVLNGNPVSFSASSPGSINPVNATTLDGTATTSLTSNQEGTVIVSADNGVEVVTTTVEFVTDANPELIITKSAPAEVNPNAELAYSIFVINKGDIALTDITISDVLDNEILDLGFMESNYPYDMSGNTYTFDIGVLNINQFAKLLITAPVRITAADKILNNTAVGNAIGLPELVTSNMVTTTIKPLGQFSSSFAKHATPAMLRAGETITYTIVYTNESNVSVTNVRITDTLPSQISELVSIDPDGASIVQGSLSTLEFNKALMAANEILTITIVGQMQQSPWPSKWNDVPNVAQSSSDDNPTLLQAPVNSLVAPDVTNQITLQSSDAVAFVGNSVVITATVVDQYDNYVLDGTETTFTANPFGTLSLSSTTTLNGQSVVNLTGNTVGSVTIMATTEGITSTTIISFINEGSSAFDIYLPLILK